MNRSIRPGLTLLVVVLASASTAQEKSATAVHMHEHLLRVTEIRSAIIRGDLDDVRQPAAWLADHEAPPDTDLLFVPFVLTMQNHAHGIVEAQDIAGAAAGVGAIATDCGNCHQASEVEVAFGNDADPPAWSDMESHMQRHQWAIDRLWEGLIAPSHASWSRGIRMLAEAPLHGTEALWDDEVTDGDELARRVHTLGREAALALTPEARSEIYGEMLQACAECHTRTGGGPAAN